MSGDGRLEVAEVPGDARPAFRFLRFVRGSGDFRLVVGGLGDGRPVTGGLGDGR